MKRAYSHKSAIYTSIVAMVIFGGLGLVSLIAMIHGIIAEKTNHVVIYSIATVFLMVCFIFSLVAMNRDGCIIKYDSDKKVIHREGFLCGYKYQLKMEDVKEVVVAFVPQAGFFYFLIDPHNTKYTTGSKKSFIMLRETEENTEFIKQFWDKPITEYREYADYVKLVTNNRT